MRLRSCNEAASLVVETGLSDFSFMDLFHSVGSRQFPHHSWTCRYTLYGYCSAASLVGGRDPS